MGQDTVTRATAKQHGDRLGSELHLWCQPLRKLRQEDYLSLGVQDCIEGLHYGHLPYFCRGQVVHGFGRGSKQLGIPTANFPEQVVDNLPADLSTGINYGWASVGSGDVHKMVVSTGWNPYYKNTKSMETHIMHTFKEDFCGEILNVAVVGYFRPQKNFDSLESLISAIQGDIEEAKK
uniref:Riboflavin kinase n=1 Tax=Aotus nancymaae TaxID=37293 RepID=A0A2K5C090_AOTNA